MGSEKKNKKLEKMAVKEANPKEKLMKIVETTRTTVVDWNRPEPRTEIYVEIKNRKVLYFVWGPPPMCGTPHHAPRARPKDRKVMYVFNNQNSVSMSACKKLYKNTSSPKKRVSID